MCLLPWTFYEIILELNTARQEEV